MINHSTSQSLTLFNLLVQANKLKYQEDYRAALVFYNKAVTQFGEEVPLLMAIAHCYYGAIEIQQCFDLDANEGTKWLQKAISIEPNNSHLYVLLAEYHVWVLVDYEQAALAYRKAIELDTTNVQALIGASALYGPPENVVTLAEAIQWLEKAVKIQVKENGYLIIHPRLGSLYYEAGRIHDAREQWLAALLSPRAIQPRLAQSILDRLKTEKST